MDQLWRYHHSGITPTQNWINAAILSLSGRIYTPIDVQERALVSDFCSNIWIYNVQNLETERK